MNQFNTRIKMKKDSEENLNQNNPILLNGEIILIDTDSGELRAKVGDGVKTYTQLPFTDEILRNLITGKQNKLTGTQGQYVGFNSSGEAEAVDPPSSLPEGGSEGKLLGYGTEPEWVDSPVMYVTFTMDTAGTVTCSNTPKEIATAYNSGRTIHGVMLGQGGNPNNETLLLRVVTSVPDEDIYYALFNSVVYSMDSIWFLYNGIQQGEQVRWVRQAEEALEQIRRTVTNHTVPTSAWSADSTYTSLGFNYRASVSVSDVTTSYIPDVNFSPADQYSGNLASFADTYNGGVYIYAKTKPTETVTIESAIFTRS